MKWARYGDKKNVGTRPVSDKLLTRRGDYSRVYTQRDLVNHFPIGHLFYCDKKTGKLYLSSSFDEAKLLHDRHRLTPLRDERDAPWVETDAKTLNRLQTQLEWRCEDIVDSDEFMLRPIKNGRGKVGSHGTDLLLALSKDVKIYSNDTIIASLPIMSRVAPEQPDDAFMSNPICEAQLKSTNDKWLLCVPMDWIYHFQKEATDHNHTMNKWLRTKQLDYGDTPFPPIDSTASRIDYLIAAGFFNYRNNEWPEPDALFFPKLRLTKRGTAQRAPHLIHARRRATLRPFRNLLRSRGAAARGVLPRAELAGVRCQGPRHSRKADAPFARRRVQGYLRPQREPRRGDPRRPARSAGEGARGARLRMHGHCGAGHFRRRHVFAVSF